MLGLKHLEASQPRTLKRFVIRTATRPDLKPTPKRSTAGRTTRKPKSPAEAVRIRVEEARLEVCGEAQVGHVRACARACVGGLVHSD